MFKSAPRVVGHDPGVDFGLTFLTGLRVDRCASGRLRHDGTERLLELWDYVDGAIVNHRPDLYVLEGYSMGSRGGSGVYSTAEMGGTIRLVCAARKVPLLIVQPTVLLKFITGVGKKQAGEKMTPLHVYKRWGVECDTSHMAESYGLARFGYHVLSGDLGGLIAPQKEVVEKHGQEGNIVRPPVPGPRRKYRDPWRLRDYIGYFDR